MKRHYLIAIVCLVGQSLHWTAAAVTPTEINQLDSSYLSKLRFEYRNLPKLSQCSQFWKSLDARLKGEEFQHTGLPLVNQVDTNLIVQVSDLLKSKTELRGGNSLIGFLDDCVQLINDHRQNNGIQPDTPVNPIATPIVDTVEEKPADRTGLVELLRKNKELITQVDEFERQRDDQIMINEQLQSQIKQLLNELEKKKVDVESPDATKRDTEAKKQADNKDMELKRAAEINQRLTEELEKKDKEIENVASEIEYLKQQLEQVSTQNAALKQTSGDNELIAKQLTNATDQVEALKRNIASQIEQASQQVNRSSYAEIVMYKTRIEALEMNESRLERELVAERVQHRDSSLGCEQFRTSAATCRSLLADCREVSTIAEAELSRVLERLEKSAQLYKSNLADRDAKISELTDSISKCKSEHEAEQARLDDLSYRVGQLRASEADARTQLKAKDSEWMQFKSQHEASIKRQAQVDPLTNQFEQLKAREKECQTALDLKQMRHMELWNWYIERDNQRDEARKELQACEDRIQEQQEQQQQQQSMFFYSG